MAEESTTRRIQVCLDRHHRGEASARELLLETAQGRLRRLTAKMFGTEPRLQRFEQSADVLQSASLRLWRSLAEVAPATVRDFFRLASVHIRRELLDIARRHFGPLGDGSNLASGEAGSNGRTASEMTADERIDPVTMAMWTEFHTSVERLPEAEREVFELIWYQGLSQTEAAEVLGVDRHTVHRRWVAARCRLAHALQDILPEPGHP